MPGCLGQIHYWKSAKARLISRKRVWRLFNKTTDIELKSECQNLLLRYPSRNELREASKVAARKEQGALANYNRVAIAYHAAVEAVERHRQFIERLNRRYGTAIEKIVEQFGQESLIYRFCKTSGRLDIYFGGRDEPLGEGHAHWIFDGSGTLRYRREILKKIFLFRSAAAHSGS